MGMTVGEKLSAWLSVFWTEDADSENRRRIALLVRLSTVGIAFLILFGLVACIEGNLSLCAIDMATALILAINLIDAKTRKKYLANIRIGIAFVSILYVYLYASGGVNQTAFTWYFTYPLIACYLLGSLNGGIASLLMLLPVLGMLLLNPVLPFIAHYSNDFFWRFVAAYLVVSAFSYLFERTRESNREELKSINQSLEDLVEKRTSALVAANRQLREEIDKRKKAHQSMRRSQEILVTILDSIDATIYVADMETYEILFMNQHMKEIFGRDMTGELCWRAASPTISTIS